MNDTSMQGIKNFIIETVKEENNTKHLKAIFWFVQGLKQNNNDTKEKE